MAPVFPDFAIGEAQTLSFKSELRRKGLSLQMPKRMKKQEICFLTKLKLYQFDFELTGSEAVRRQAPARTVLSENKTSARTPCGANAHFSPFPPGDGGREGFVR